MTDLLLWLDLETTGADDHKGDCIIEIGCIMTTTDLEEIGRYQSFVRPSAEGLGRLMFNTKVREMHEKNGLLEELLPMCERGDGLGPDRVAKALGLKIDEWLKEGEAGRYLLAGSGVAHFDRRFLVRYMPKVLQRARYYSLDVGVLRRAYAMWTGDLLINQNDFEKPHRAIDDVVLHIEEAKAFREFFIAPTD